MTRPYAAWCLSIATLGITGTANAAVEWWMISSQGQQPRRTVFYADAGAVVHGNTASGNRKSGAKEFDWVLLDVLQVKEATASPETVNYRLQFQCDDKLMHVLIATAKMPSGAEVRAQVPAGWHPITLDWTERAYRFACQPQARQTNGMIKLESNVPGGITGDLSAESLAERTRQAVWNMTSAEKDRMRGLSPDQIEQIRKAQVIRDAQTLFDAPNVVDLPSE